jgi:hypothetical protein
MIPSLAQARARLADRRGVALPIALIGLVAISLLVTTALLTSGTEYAVSRAGGDATTGLYAADAAVQKYLADSVTNYNQGTYSFPGTDGKTYSIRVNDLGMRRTAAAAGGLNFRVFSVGAERSGGGRGVVAMVRVPLEMVTFSTTIHAGASLGQNATIGGSIMISDSSNLCNQAGTDWAVQHAQGTSLTINGQAGRNIGNDTSTFAGTRTQMADYILNGLNLNDLANNADIKFGRKFNKAAFSGSPSGSSSDPNYDWGCPREMVSGCAAADTGKYQIIAIDASNSDGSPGGVTINGDYGQGLLVVLNGDLRLQGNFVFKGIVLVEGSTDIHGGGGSGGSKIEGALLGFGNLNICANSSDTCLDTSTSISDTGNTSISSGTVIDYNRCAITAVENAINLNRSIQKAPTRPSFAWFEVVR